MEEKGHLDAIEGPQNCHQVIYLCWRYLSKEREREAVVVEYEKLKQCSGSKVPKRSRRI